MPGASSPAGATSRSIIVQDVATGARRSWTAWPSSYLQISQLFISDSALVSYGSVTVSGDTVVSPVPGAAAGILSPGGRSVYAQVVTPRGASRLVELNAADGRTTRVLLSGPRAAQAAPVGIDGRELLFTLGVRHAPAHHGGAAYVSGHLAGLDLATGRITRLPYPVYTGVAVPAWPMVAAW